MKEADKTVEHMKNDSTAIDPNDAATQEEELRLELRTRDRERKLIIKIDHAKGLMMVLWLLEDTGEPIGIKRLARPVATLCIEPKKDMKGLKLTN